MPSASSRGCAPLTNRWPAPASLDGFDFFILSDSTDPDKWVEEERRWPELLCDLDALGKIYYRRRLFNEERKSGNVRDFLNTWGRRYRYFICCDADSVMRGETLVDLVKLMEAHPTVGPDSDRAGAGQRASRCSGASSNLPTGFMRRCSSRA